MRVSGPATSPAERRPAPARVLLLVTLVLGMLAAACADGSTPPARAAAAQRVVVLGGSVASELVPALRAAFPDGDVIDETLYGVPDLADEVLFDWRSEWPVLVEGADVVVAHVTFGSATLDDCSDACRVRQAEERYGPLVEEMARTLAAPGRDVLWLGQAPIRGIPMTGAIDAVAADRAAQVDGVTFVDVFGLLGGRFELRLPVGDDPRARQIRKDDGVHLCPAGVEVILDAALDELVATRPAPGWQTAPWRSAEPFGSCDDQPRTAS